MNMKRNTLLSALLFAVLAASSMTAQPLCDFSTTASTPLYGYTSNSGAAYTTWTPGSMNWEITTSSGIGIPAAGTRVLHTNPGSGTGSQSPQWLISQQISGFNWRYNEMQWSFWFGRRANNGQNGGSQDRSSVWLYVNNNTNLTNLTGLEGIRLTWHHNGNADGMQLVEVHGGVEHIISDFVMLTNLSDYQWGATVIVKRIPSGTPTGSQVRWKIYLSTPVPGTANFASYRQTADADPLSTATFLRADTLLSVEHTWIPSSTTGRVGVMSDFALSRKDAAEYNQLCVTDIGPVPVELTSFSAQYRNKSVRLSWNTATENNNSGFEIQRSIEHNGNWETIGFVEGAGNSNTSHTYTYSDVPANTNVRTIAYRLKQIDVDGTYEYSNTVLVSIAAASGNDVYNFPNPFNPATTITFNLESADVVTLSVYNAAGAKVADLYNGVSLAQGAHSVSFNGASLPSGRYLYSLTTSAGTVTNTMVLSK